MLTDLLPLGAGQARRIVFVLVFAFFTVLAGMATFGQGVLADTPPTAGTIPPGGTIPPPEGTIPPPPGGGGFVNFLHLAPFDGDVNNTGVDICTDPGSPFPGSVAVPGATDVYYGQQTGYLLAPVGLYNLRVTQKGSSCATVLLDLPPFNIFDGTKLTIILYGGANGHPLDSLVIVEAPGVIHVYLPLVQNAP